MAELAKISGVSEFWVGLDGRSFWNEENTTMSQKQWMSSGGDIISEIKWKNAQPEEDLTKQCVYLEVESQ